MSERFTERVRQAVVLALKEAGGRRQGAVGRRGAQRVDGRSEHDTSVWEFPDLGTSTTQELENVRQRLLDQEVEISYRRRMLHAKIDILRAELVNRLRAQYLQREEG
jgi:hypothetical protein